MHLNITNHVALITGASQGIDRAIAIQLAKDANNNNLSREEYAAQFCHNVLAKQSIGKPEDVALLVCYLCSESARWIMCNNPRS